MEVDIDKVLGLRAQLDEINRLDFEDITFVQDGKEVEISEEIKEHWLFIGLNNVDFITSGFYKTSEFEINSEELTSITRSVR